MYEKSVHTQKTCMCVVQVHTPGGTTIGSTVYYMYMYILATTGSTTVLFVHLILIDSHKHVFSYYSRSRVWYTWCTCVPRTT